MKVILRNALTLVALTVLLSGCIAPQPTRPEPSYAPTFAQMPTPVAASAGSAYLGDYSLELFGDRRALRPGDVITIRLEERTSSSKSAETSISKESESQMLEPIVYGSLIRGPASNAGVGSSLESENEFSGSAESDQSNSLDGTITAIVANVLPNGLLLVQGEKWLNLNRGEEYLRVSGLVRQEDIDADNSISSQRLADARIAYSGTGELADSNRAGWLTRFFLSPFAGF